MRFLLMLAACVGLGSMKSAALSIEEHPPEPMTVRQLGERSELYVKESPKDPMGLLTLGRIHAAAFRYRAFYLNSKWSTQFRKNVPPAVSDSEPKFAVSEAEAILRVLKRKGLKAMPARTPEFQGEVDSERLALENAGWVAPVMTPKQELEHFLAATEAIGKSIRMEPVGRPSHEGRCVLALALVWSEFSRPERQERLRGLAEVPAPNSKAELAELFYRAFTLAKEWDRRTPEYRDRLSKKVSYSAGGHYLMIDPEGEHAAEVRRFMEDARAKAM